MPSWAIFAIIVAIFIVILVVVAIGYWNSFVLLNGRVEEAFATMDVYLKKRWDLIPNLVETVKSFTGHESKVMTEITKLRAGVKYDNLSEDEKINANRNMASSLTKLIATAEDYPELTSSKNFMELDEQLSHIEEDIANARKYFNATVLEYNNKVELIPSCIFAKLFGFKKKNMFTIASSERENIKIDL